MKLPQTGRRKALIVVDVQPAFIKPHNAHVIDNIKKLIENVEYDAYVEAVFSAEVGSLWDEQQMWVSPKDENTRTIPELHAVLEPKQPLQVEKSTRSVFRGDRNVLEYLKNNDIEEVHVVGTETNDCVLATAFDAFDSGFLVFALEECCEAATVGRHQMGVDILRLQGMTNNRCVVDTIDVSVE